METCTSYDRCFSTTKRLRKYLMYCFWSYTSILLGRHIHKYRMFKSWGLTVIVLKKLMIEYLEYSNFKECFSCLQNEGCFWLSGDILQFSCSVVPWNKIGRFQSAILFSPPQGTTHLQHSCSCLPDWPKHEEELGTHQQACSDCVLFLWQHKKCV